MADKQQLIAGLRLYNTNGVGAASYIKLVEQHGSEEKALDALNHINKVSNWSVDRATQELEQCQRKGIVLLHYSDEEYPQALKSLNDFPPLLYAKGNLQALNQQMNAAIVGARSASLYGCKMASKIAYDLAEKGVCIISGMARGIDGAAHQGALLAQGEKGVSVAVLGTGVDVIYPIENSEIYNQIQENGCIISEFALGSEGLATNFPRRNRIISALSQAVLVVEAGMKSGSLITADYAMKQGKFLFAVPGTPSSANASGSNYLIKKGAMLAESAQDILPYILKAQQMPKQEYTKPRQKVLVFENNDVKFSSDDEKQKTGSLTDYLTVDGVLVDELIRLTGKDSTTIAAEILELELNGTAQRLSGGRVALIK